jgi:hypothetical protein
MARMNIGSPGCNVTSKILNKVEIIYSSTYTILIFMPNGNLMIFVP